MKLTKYQHACFTVEHQGKLLVVDPGNLTTDLGALDDVVAIIITHAHNDHFDPAAVDAIFARNPSAKLYAPAGVISALNIDIPHQVVEPGEIVDLEPFKLHFYGGLHAVIHPDLPRLNNVGVLINQTIYYAGDSLVVPDQPVDTLLMPAAAPWMHIGQAIDFLLNVKPRLAIPTHDAIYSDAGKQIADAMLGKYAKDVGIEYRRLSETIEVAPKG